MSALLWFSPNTLLVQDKQFAPKADPINFKEPARVTAIYTDYSNFKKYFHTVVLTMHLPL